MLGKENKGAVVELGEGTIESEGTWWRTLGPAERRRISLEFEGTVVQRTCLREDRIC